MSGYELHAYCGATNPSLVAFPSVTLAIYVPMYLPVGGQVKGFWWGPGGTAAGVVEVALYGEDGTQKGTTLTTTISSANSLQSASVTPFLIPAGRYYTGIAVSSLTPTFRRWACVQATEVRCFGVQQETLGAAPAAGNAWLPTTATFASPANNYIPNIGFYLHSNII